MSIKLGNTEINKVYLGGSQIYRMYLGVKLFFSKLFDFSDFNVAINSNKWVVGEDGLLTEVLAGDLPYTYVNGYGQLLVEDESNIIGDNNSDLSVFSKINATSEIAGIISPTGLYDCYKITSNGGTQARVEKSFSLPLTGSYYTFSAFVKKGNTDFVALSRFSPTAFAVFDLNNKIVTNSNLINHSILELSNGWFRISITDYVSESATYNIWKINVTNSPTSYIDSENGDYLFAYGPQLELGLKATSYAPNYNASSQRLADEITKTPPIGTTLITETINGVDNEITTIPTLYQVPNGLIDKVIFS